MTMARKLETKEFPFVLTKMDEEAGTFTGYASIWDVVDTYGDSVAKGAFRKTLRDNESFPMLWSHSTDTPIGIITGKEDKTGLSVEGKLNLDVQRAVEIRSLMKQKAIKGLSIGYQTLKEDSDREAGTRILKEIKLWEISPCVFQACPNALIEDVKSEIINIDGESVELCDECLALLNKEPEESTPETKPLPIVEPVADHSIADQAEVIKKFRESQFHGGNHG
jgi:HK97 family phage prohead protease